MDDRLVRWVETLPTNRRDLDTVSGVPMLYQGLSSIILREICHKPKSHNSAQKKRPPNFANMFINVYQLYHPIYPLKKTVVW